MLCFGEVAIIRADESGLFVFACNSMVERVKDVLPGLNGHLGGALHDGGIITDWEFQCSKSLHIVSGGRGRKSGQDCGDLGEPMRG